MAVSVSYEADSFGRTERQVARVHYGSTLPFEFVVSEAARGNARSESDLRESFERIAVVITELLAQGRRVKTPIGTFALGLRRESQAVRPTSLRNRIGVADPRLFSVTPARLKMVFRANRSVMREIRGKARIERIESHGRRMPVIHSVRSLERSGGAAEQLLAAPGELLQIDGRALAADTNDRDQGVFFAPAAGEGGEVRVELYAHTGTRRIVFKCPSAPPGLYHVVVRTRPTGASIREGTANTLVAI